jgi:hypothetical protein
MCPTPRDRLLIKEHRDRVAARLADLHGPNPLKDFRVHQGYLDGVVALSKKHWGNGDSLLILLRVRSGPLTSTLSCRDRLVALGALGTSIARIGHLRAVAAHRQLKSACGLSIALAVGVGLSALAVCVAFECPRCRVRSV